MAEIALEHVTKEFAGGVRAVDGVDLTVGSGEFLVLVGPSGCGKSTLLRMIAGLEEVSGGKISIGEREVTNLSPRDRDIAMVFQNYALYPHYTVEKNLAYGLRVRGTPRHEIERRVNEVAEMLGLEQLLQRRPSALSGGQRQRVAMGRAIVREPAAFLMDEPLSNLDAKLRVDMRAQLARLHSELGVTTVYVTHDQVEAMTLGQRVAVMRDGRIQQVDSPQNLYRRPANLFVAAFIGSPPMNLVDAEVEGGELRFADVRVPLDGRDVPPGRVVLGIRPQDLALADGGSRVSFEAEPAVVEELGSATHAIFPVEAPPVDTDAVRAASDEGERGVLLATDRRALFTAALPEGAPAVVGRRMRLALDPSRFHFFDPESGARLDPESARQAEQLA
ncbi:MAG TPA: sn-glycerol-3-phosphate ABC transporter ATP-binding protein UgpC [Gaiellaceae bacterium]|nr:sn-glycerol-3-phosphate ABC transporter ATP-binding protein UgpC [Gaiellaceae bacterium]